MPPPTTQTPRSEDRCIAVITVCRNPGPLLAQAIDSVRRLDDARVRHIVIDGASTDGTVNYIKSMEGALHYWSSEPDRGIYDAMNKGWAIAPRDSYVLFIGADDRLLGLPSVDELRRAEALGCSIIFGTTDVESGPFESSFDRGIRWRNTLHHQSLLIAKELSPAPPFDDRFRVYGDWDFNARLWQAGHKAMRSASLRAYAAARGVSSTIPLRETFRVGFRNFGFGVGLGAWARAVKARIRAIR